jgi:hypothetical protein
MSLIAPTLRRHDIILPMAEKNADEQPSAEETVRRIERGIRPLLYHAAEAAREEESPIAAAEITATRL